MNMKKLFLLNLPYLLFVYPFDKLAQAFRRVLFQRKVNAVFLCRTLKGFDIAVSDFDAAYACVLLHKLF